MSGTALRCLHNNDASAKIYSRTSPAERDVEFTASIHLDQRTIAQAQHGPRARGGANSLAFAKLLSAFSLMLARGIYAIQNSIHRLKRSAISRRRQNSASSNRNAQYSGNQNAGGNRVLTKAPMPWTHYGICPPWQNALGTLICLGMHAAHSAFAQVICNQHGARRT